MNIKFHDIEYTKLVNDVLLNGRTSNNRTGKPARSVFARQMRFDVSDYTIPMLTTKKMFTRGTIVELLDLFVAGEQSIRPIQEQNVHIWDEWADEHGSIGPAYGFQWRKWPKYLEVGAEPGGLTHCVKDYVDQLQILVDTLKKNPHDRRMIVSAWNVADLDEMALPPCHYLFQCYSEEMTLEERIEWASLHKNHYVGSMDIVTLADEEAHAKLLDTMDVPKYSLSLMLNQRSADVGLGVPFNIVQYTMLLLMLCEVVGMAPKEFIWSGGIVHIYEDHVEKLKGQMTNAMHPSPTLKFKRKIESIDDFKLDDFIIDGYVPGPKIDMKVAV